MTKLLLGKEVADSIITKCKVAARAITEQVGQPPILAVVSVGKNSSNEAYIKGIKNKVDEAKIKLVFYNLDTHCKQSELEELICKLNANSIIKGILLMRPFPKESGIDEQAVCNLIVPHKDVDCVGLKALSNAYTGQNGFLPCTAEACMQILKHYNINLEGKNVVVIGRSLVVGKPVANLLLRENATVTICHSKTKNLSEIVKRADVVVVAIGCAKMLDENYFRPGQIVIDAGINWDTDAKKLCGDVNFDAVNGIVDAITPVPGGVGAVTSAVLLKHTLSC